MFLEKWPYHVVTRWIFFVIWRERSQAKLRRKRITWREREEWLLWPVIPSATLACKSVYSPKEINNHSFSLCFGVIFHCGLYVVCNVVWLFHVALANNWMKCFVLEIELSKIAAQPRHLQRSLNDSCDNDITNVITNDITDDMFGSNWAWQICDATETLGEKSMA